MFELHHLTAQELWDWIRRGESSPREVADHFLARIERLDPGLGAFVTVDADGARDRADHLADRVPTSRPLWGLASGDKDLYDREGMPTRSGSAATAAGPAAADHPLVAAMDAAGAVSLGRTATPEFGMSSMSETALGTTRNPWDVTRGPGGSSSGAAAAVAAGLLPAAVGSDGGGSVRIPAAATGLVGLKPSRGRVPAMPGRSGLGGLSVAGPLTRTVADAGMFLDALVAPTGTAAAAPYALVTPDPDGVGPFTAAAVRGEGRFALGVLSGSPWDDTVDVTVDPAATAAVELAVATLTELGHGVEDVAMPRDAYARWFTTAWTASAARLSRVPGIDLGRLSPLVAWLHERGQALGGVEVLDAMAGLDAFSEALIGAFARFDAVLTPTLAMTPRPLGWYSDDPEENFAQQCRYSPWTSMVNVAGLPAVTLPVGETGNGHPDGGGLPMGVQLIGRPGGERTLLALGAQLERRLRWQRRHPPMW